MLKRFVTVIAVMALSTSVLGAQAAKPPAASAQAKAVDVKKEAPVKAAPEPAPLPVNIKIEVSITDQSGNNPPAKKVVTMIASDRKSTNVRSGASVPVKSPTFGAAVNPQPYTYRTVQINVDALPSIVQKEPNKVAVNFGLEYLPTSRSSAQEEAMEPGLTSWNERLSVILESGKPMIVSQAADPTSDRRITVEVTATILK